MAGGNVFTAGYAPVKNPATSPASWYPYSHTGTVPFRAPLTPSDVVRIDTQPNGNDATELFLLRWHDHARHAQCDRSQHQDDIL